MKRVSKEVERGKTLQDDLVPTPRRVLSDDQMKRCKEAFDSFDSNRNNRIEIQELEEALVNMGHRPSEEELYRMMNEENQDGDNSITWDRFLRIIEQQKIKIQNEMRPDLLDTFAALGGGDNGNGFIDLSKVKDIITNKFGMTINLEKLASKLDTNNDMEIEFSEFMDMMTG